MRFLSRFSLAAIAALVVLATATAGVNTPQSGWYSGSPLLGPNALRDLTCAESTCYASGDFGTLLKSSDAGATWTGIVTGLTLDLPRVELIGGSPDRIVVGGGCALRRSDDGGSTFKRLPFTARDQGCSAPLVAFSFPAQNTGYVLLTGGRFLTTTDGGRSFARRTTVPSNANDLLCTGPLTCFTAGAGSIQRTDDGGVSWTQFATSSATLNRLAAAGPLTLYAVGQVNTVAKSVDGGLTWQTNYLAGVTSRELTTIACGDELHCLITTRDSPTSFGPLYRTTDGGESATAVTPSEDPSFAVAFTSATHAISAGFAGSAQISTDAGATWAAVGTRNSGAVSTLAACGNVAYAGMLGALVRTGDAGQSWSSVSPPTDGAIMSLAPAGPDRLYVLAGDNTVQRSDNGGGSYSSLNQGAFRPTAIAAIDRDRLLLLGRGARLSKNGGDSFSPATGKIARAQLQAADLAVGAVFAYGPVGIFASTDRGDHWRAVARPKRRAILDVDFVGPNIGYLLDTRGALWKTTNGGGNWTVMPGVGSPAYAVEFSSPSNGYLAVRGFGSLRGGGVVLRTTDGGRSWHPQIVSPFPMSALESGGSVDYALAGMSALYATTVGGDVGSSSSLTLRAKPSSPGRAGRVTVSGLLTPADGGEEIVVSMLQNGRWTHKAATAASNGTFTTRWPVRRNAVFVAQVLGDADHRGAGTKPLTVKVR